MKLELSQDELAMLQGILAQVTVSGKKHVKTLMSLMDKLEVPDADSTERAIPNSPQS